MDVHTLSRLTRLRLGLALIGLVVWLSGVRVDDANTRLVGMVILAMTLLLRFVPKRFHGETGQQEQSD